MQKTIAGPVHHTLGSPEATMSAWEASLEEPLQLTVMRGGFDEDEEEETEAAPFSFDEDSDEE